jgi:hypothetical protein
MPSQSLLVSDDFRPLKELGLPFPDVFQDSLRGFEVAFSDREICLSNETCSVGFLPAEHIGYEFLVRWRKRNSSGLPELVDLVW